MIQEMFVNAALGAQINFKEALDSKTWVIRGTYCLPPAKAQTAELSTSLAILQLNQFYKICKVLRLIKLRASTSKKPKKNRKRGKRGERRKSGQTYSLLRDLW